LEKVTEASVFNAVEVQDGVKSADEEYEDSVYCCNLFEAAKQAFEQRKTSIENLVKLYNQGYWSRPNTESKDSRNVMETMAEESMVQQQDTIGKTLLKRKITK